MRKIIHDIITEEESRKLSGGRKLLAGTTDPVMLKILDRLRNEGCFAMCDKSYSRREEKSDGHPWHTDTGSFGHMQWCRFGCSMLMPNCTFEGGALKYEKDGIIDIIDNQKPLDMYVHTSDEQHMVDPITAGRRLVFLLFL